LYCREQGRTRWLHPIAFSTFVEICPPKNGRRNAHISINLPSILVIGCTLLILTNSVAAISLNGVDSFSSVY